MYRLGEIKLCTSCKRFYQRCKNTKRLKVKTEHLVSNLYQEDTSILDLKVPYNLVSNE